MATETKVDETVNTELESAKPQEEVVADETTQVETPAPQDDEISVFDVEGEEKPKDAENPADKPVEIEAVEEPADKTLTEKEKQLWYKNRRLQKEIEALKKAQPLPVQTLEAKPAIETKPAETTGIPKVEVPQAAAERNNALQQAFDSGQLDISWEDLQIQKAVIIVEEKQKIIAQQAQQQARVVEAQQSFVKAVKARTDLPNVEQAIQKLVTLGGSGSALSNAIKTDGILERAVIGHPTDGGIDLAYYLGNHPKLTAELMEMSPYDRAIKLESLRVKLVNPKKPVQKPNNFKPSPQIQNSVEPVKSGELDEISAFIAEENAKIRARQKSAKK